ncbi:hypothetical protein BpHYR1_006203 [Brachionus plicatilis]|uniref:C2H2-type domain-containing protein n=1 Tax=Brachionus plicatilis TaxID=10195 RepID=A0A3M7R483_BRAPC|nr:hypothetical protein BpHYR1_006203 [Brachionus plicatilis]
MKFKPKHVPIISAINKSKRIKNENFTRKKHKNKLPCDGNIFFFQDQSNEKLEKQFKCNECNLDFARREHLTRHKQSLKHKTKLIQQNLSQDKSQNSQNIKESIHKDGFSLIVDEKKQLKESSTTLMKIIV